MFSDKANDRYKGPGGGYTRSGDPGNGDFAVRDVPTTRYDSSSLVARVHQATIRYRTYRPRHGWAGAYGSCGFRNRHHRDKPDI